MNRHKYLIALKTKGEMDRLYEKYEESLHNPNTEALSVKVPCEVTVIKLDRENRKVQEIDLDETSWDVRYEILKSPLRKTKFSKKVNKDSHESSALNAFYKFMRKNTAIEDIDYYIRRAIVDGLTPSQIDTIINPLTESRTCEKQNSEASRSL